MKGLLGSRAVTVIASAAIFGLLAAGGAVAKAKIGSSDIRNQSIMKADLGPNSVGSSELADRSVGLADLGPKVRTALGRTGKPGPTGLPGPQGPKGDPGPVATPAVSYIDQTFTTTQTSERVSVPCPNGTDPIALNVKGDHTAGYNLGSDWVDTTTNAYTIQIGNSNGDGKPVQITLQVICLG